ncbi:Zinc finger MYND domain-containing protein 12 [Rhizoclosmatium sp. JEL0117]|nr:Zinc finger MYND domain-containing protein 12 [Rhizoclosmatium sp. JEL0117]
MSTSFAPIPPIQKRTVGGGAGGHNGASDTTPRRAMMKSALGPGSDGQPLSLHATFINPLANPKGIKLGCELCGKPAYIQCKDCRVTFYCDKEHQGTDFRGIHEKICSLLIPLRTPVSVLGSEEERIHRDKQTRHRQIQLLELSKTEAHKKLFEGQYDLAIPAALQALRFSMDVYGQDSIQLVPSYLLLGEASIGLKQYPQAEDYLSLAKWAILKVPDCEHRIRSQMHRNFGLLYASLGKYDDALAQLSQDIYYASLVKGPEHISVLGGYFQLGNVFQKLEGRGDVVAAVFDKVVGVWKKALREGEGEEEREVLDEAQQAEAVQMLTTIYTFRTSFAASSTGPAEVNYVLGQLHHIYGNSERAKEYVGKALEVYEAVLGREHSLTIEARNFFKSVVKVGGVGRVTSAGTGAHHGGSAGRRRSIAR